MINQRGAGVGGALELDLGPSHPGDSGTSGSARAGARSSFSVLLVIPCSCPLDSTIQTLPSQFEIFVGSKKTQRSLSPDTSFQGWRNRGPEGECGFHKLPLLVIVSSFLFLPPPLLSESPPCFSLVSLSLQMHHPSPGTAGTDASSFQGLEQETPGCVADLSPVFAPEAVVGARVGQFWW